MTDPNLRDDLQRYWNELVERGVAEPSEFDPVLADVMRRERWELDPVTPDSAYAKQLREDLMNQSMSAATGAPGVIPTPYPSLNGQAKPRQARDNFSSRPTPGINWRLGRWEFAQLATALLLLTTLGLGYLAFKPFDRGSGGHASIPAVVAPLQVENNDVTMFRANLARTGEMSGPGPDPALAIVERWSFTANGVIYDSPAVVDGVVYMSTLGGKTIYALDASTGEQRWMFPTQGEIFSSPAVMDGVVYVGSDDDHLYALDAISGELVWSFAAGAGVNSSPAVVNGVVYVGSYDRNLYAIDAVTGAQRWAFDTGNPVESSPAVVDGVVYVGSGNYTVSRGNVHAIDAVTGEQRWVFAAGGPVTSSPAVVDGVVYAGSFDNNVYAIDAASGEQRWAFETDDDIVASSPAVVNGVVYVGNGTIHATVGTLYALDAASGELRWSFVTGGNIFGSPAVTDGVVYFGSWDHNLYALDAATGNERWSFTTGDIVTSSPAVVDGVVYFGGEDSVFYALESAK